MIASVGGLVINSSSSYLFPYDRDMPFIIFGAFTILTYLCSTLIYFKMIRQKPTLVWDYNDKE